MAVNILWLALGAGVLVGLAMWMTRRHQHSGVHADLGSVSQQWVAEHRLSQSSDPPR